MYLCGLPRTVSAGSSSSPSSTANTAPGELRRGDVGREVRLAGWVAHRRDHGSQYLADAFQKQAKRVIVRIFLPGLEDAVVLSADPFSVPPEGIGTIDVEMTIFDGRVVHSRQ